MKTRKDKRMVKLEFTFSKLPFLGIYIFIYKKISTFTFGA